MGLDLFPRPTYARTRPTLPTTVGGQKSRITTHYSPCFPHVSIQGQSPTRRPFSTQNFIDCQWEAEQRLFSDDDDYIQDPLPTSNPAFTLIERETQEDQGVYIEQETPGDMIRIIESEAPTGDSVLAEVLEVIPLTTEGESQKKSKGGIISGKRKRPDSDNEEGFSKYRYWKEPELGTVSPLGITSDGIPRGSSQPIVLESDNESARSI